MNQSELIIRERWGEFKPTAGERVTDVGKGFPQRIIQQHKHASTLSNPRKFVVTLYVNAELRSIEVSAFDAINAIRIVCRVYRVATSSVISIFKSKQP
jgi:hypothetical protein